MRAEADPTRPGAPVDHARRPARAPHAHSTGPPPAPAAPIRRPLRARHRPTAAFIAGHCPAAACPQTPTACPPPANDRRQTVTRHLAPPTATTSARARLTPSHPLALREPMIYARSRGPLRPRRPGRTPVHCPSGKDSSWMRPVATARPNDAMLVAQYSHEAPPFAIPRRSAAWWLLPSHQITPDARYQPAPSRRVSPPIRAPAPTIPSAPSFAIPRQVAACLPLPSPPHNFFAAFCGMPVRLAAHAVAPLPVATWRPGREDPTGRGRGPRATWDSPRSPGRLLARRLRPPPLAASHAWLPSLSLRVIRPSVSSL